MPQTLQYISQTRDMEKDQNQEAEQLESLKNNSSSDSGWGGAREGAGRPEGSENQSTKAKRIALQRFQDRVMENADRLFNAQFAIAVGAQMLFRIDTVEYKDANGKTKTKKEHVLVTDEDEIRETLDSDLINGQDYYYLTTEKPDNRAIESMLDRTFGKAQQSIDLTSHGEKVSGYVFEVIDKTEDIDNEEENSDN